MRPNLITIMKEKIKLNDRLKSKGIAYFYNITPIKKIKTKLNLTQNSK